MDSLLKGGKFEPGMLTLFVWFFKLDEVKFIN